MALKYTDMRVDGFIKGSIAETIFLRLHLEHNCEVHRTGVEFLYPNLLDKVNVRKSKSIKDNKNNDIIEIKRDLAELHNIMNLDAFNEAIKEYGLPAQTGLNGSEELLDKDAKKIHYLTRTSETELTRKISKSPDFMIVTPNGNLFPFEVKYRHDGSLNEYDLETGKLERTENEVLADYLYDGEDSPYMFIVMRKKPYLRILDPRKVSKYNSNEIDDILIKALIKEYEMTKEKALKIINQWRTPIRDEYTYCETFGPDFHETPTLLQGFRFTGPVVPSSEIFHYDAGILAKYQKIIKETFYKLELDYNLAIKMMPDNEPK